MVTDIAASFPVDALGALGGAELKAALRLPHLLRIVHLRHYISRVAIHFQRWDVFELRVTARGLLAVVSTLLLVNHWYGCLWVIIHRYALRSSSKTWAIKDSLSVFVESEHTHVDVWSDNKHGQELTNVSCMAAARELCMRRAPWGSRLFCCFSHHYRPCLACAPAGFLVQTATGMYIRAFYFVITVMSTVGYGDIRPYTEGETMFNVVVVLTGACIFAAIIGSLAAHFSYLDSTGFAQFRSKRKTLQKYMAYRSLPPALQASINYNYRSMLERRGCLNERDVVAILPRSLQMEIATCLHRTLFAR